MSMFWFWSAATCFEQDVLEYSEKPNSRSQEPQQTEDKLDVLSLMVADTPQERNHLINKTCNNFITSHAMLKSSCNYNILLQHSQSSVILCLLL